MRIHIHDGSGHPFQVQLSRELARRGHTVLHTHASQWVSGHGRLTTEPGDPPTLRIEAITAPREYDKYSPRKRIAWEISYAREWQRILRREPWDVVVSCNTQLITAALMRRYFRRRSQAWVLWHQDIYGFALADEAARKLPRPAARLVSHLALGAEQRLVRDSDAVVAIGDPFIAQYQAWGLSVEHVRVIPNWAPLDDIIPLPRGEDWARRHGIAPTELRVLYAGMLGRKHNPQLLVDLIEQVRARGVDAQLVVASEGPGADYLLERTAASPYVRVLDFQPAADLAAMLASGDVLLAILEPEASRFSIPSKVLSYLAAGRPVLTLAPATNPCVSDVAGGGGVVLDPTPAGVERAAAWLSTTLTDPARRATIGRQARDHAEQNFDIRLIANQFEQLCNEVRLSTT